LISTGSHDRTLNIYSREDLKLVTTIKAHKRGVWDSDFDPTG